VKLVDDGYQENRKCIAGPERHRYGQKRDSDNNPRVIALAR
jgi:hypothetical protein